MQVGMFRGSSLHTLDPKGRIIIPTRFRGVVAASYGEGLMLTRMDKGLSAYTLEEWADVEKRIYSLQSASGALRRFRRVFLGGAEECRIDRQGRMLIPPVMRDYADLGKQVALVGQGRHFEIWSQERYNAEIQQFDEDLKDEAFGAEIAALGL